MKHFQLLNNIQKHITLSDTERTHLLEIIVEKNIKRKERILIQGNSCKKLFFIESGSFRAYHITDSGKESTIMFGIKDWWITDMNAFVNQESSMFNIEALESSTIYMIDFILLEKLYLEFPKFERFFRILFQNAYIREQTRALENISQSTEERYFNFINRYPLIVERITQKQIASYLGVTPEFLSSIKKN